MMLTFTRQLYTLIKAGIPLLKALQVIVAQIPKGKQRVKMEALIQQIQEGKSLSEALAAHGGFTLFYINMIKAAEVSGNLEGILKELSEHFATQRRITQQVRAAFMYPIFVLSTAGIILVILMLFVMPVFIRIFEDLGGKLPPATLFLINSSKFLSQWGWLIFVILAFASFILYLYSRQPAGAKIFNEVKWRIPLFGELFKTAEVARLSRTLGTLLSSGITLMQGLEVLIDTTPTVLLHQGLEDIRNKVEGGENLSTSMQDSGLFSLIMVRMVQVGEETGKLAEIFLDIAQDFEEEVSYKITGLLSLLEPTLIVIMGGIIGFVIVSLFFPIFTMSTVVK